MSIKKTAVVNAPEPVVHQTCQFPSGLIKLLIVFYISEACLSALASAAVKSNTSLLFPVRPLPFPGSTPLHIKM